ncbi:2-isopropylmalate synthase [Ruminococcaceae bacterium OttesenSCG-928-O06]|nr:2-isopropylmalate synthase [Ruminococcaceae bacterium OttesenSCG-928-O06]
MKHFDRYAPGYFPAPVTGPRWVQKDHIETAPIWCSVDLRDGNQSLIVPMDLEQKLAFFAFLVRLGFKEIEIGFPAASDTEYELLHQLLLRKMVPADVTLQVLTQCRDHIIEKTFESVEGVGNAIIHFYNSISYAQREQVFKMNRSEIMKIATDGAELVKKLAKQTAGNFRFEYSPESFTGTEPEYALEVCNAVLDVLQPAPDNKVIINLPATVEMSIPHIYANQIEYLSDNLKYRDDVILSIHPHNDRGTGVAATELGVLAGAQRVEGTLFGNGERTGNVDIVTLAMNLFSHGVDPNLDFSDMPSVVELYEEVTDMRVNERQPYAGSLVFAAFSGSHQDAIAKGTEWHKEKGLYRWTIPYLPIDPADVGRQYQTDVIRINSQSGKGGIGYLLEQHYGYTLPAKMREHFGYLVKGISDHEHRELSPAQVKEIFEKAYLNITTPVNVPEVHFIQKNGIIAAITVQENGQVREVTAKGNGRLDAVTGALCAATGRDFTLVTYAEHALEVGSKSQAVAYVGLTWNGSGTITWGAGQHTDIIVASVAALVSAYNNKVRDEADAAPRKTG